MKSPARGSAPGSLLLRFRWGLAEQAQHIRLALVRLGEHRRRRLAQDLRLGEVGRLSREIGVLDARARVAEIGNLVGQVVDDRLEAALAGTERGARCGDRL